MAQKALREHDAKALVAKLLPSYVEGGAAVAATQGIGLHADVLQVDMPEGGVNAVDWDGFTSTHPWVLSSKLVVKPDQLIKRRGKAGLLGINLDWPQVRAWISERMGKDVVVEGVSGPLTTFLVEPFVPHPPSDEYYVCISSHRSGEDILFHHEGGVDIGDVDSKALRLTIPIGDKISASLVAEKLLTNIPESRKSQVSEFIAALYRLYMDLHFVYLEINPLVVTGDVHTDAKNIGNARLVPLDMALKLDEAANFLVGQKWGELTFPPPFGRLPSPEEAYIHEMDGKTGASLKLTILNKTGRIWTMVAGGGASVAYADTVVDMGEGAELANYGEYSGAPSDSQSYEYAKTILKLMTSFERPDIENKVLIIGGGIANFTDVAKTFKGIIKAIKEFAPLLRAHKVYIWVRRGGPNYQEGLRQMRDVGVSLNLPIRVYGPDTHMTAIVALALGRKDVLKGLRVVEVGGDGAYDVNEDDDSPTGSEGLGKKRSRNDLSALDESNKADRTGLTDRVTDIRLNLPGEGEGAQSVTHPKMAYSSSSAALATAAIESEANSNAKGAAAIGAPASSESCDVGLDMDTPVSSTVRTAFTPDTRCIIYGMQQRAVQGMLDFDFLCKRKKPSIAAMVYPFSGNHFLKFYWGSGEIMIPVYSSTEEALERHQDADVFINFASFRSVYPSTMEVFNYVVKNKSAASNLTPDEKRTNSIRTMAIIAEGVPEQQSRLLIREADARDIHMIGPATVGGITAGAFRIGNSGGMLDNIVSCKLYRPGSVAYVSKSGGMSNELNNLISQYTDGVAEGVAIGGDRYPGSRFLEHLLRYEANPNVKMTVLLGEVGGTDEYDVVNAIREGKLKKPMVAWCAGTCAKVFPYEVQFGHAGALANSAAQTAAAKNEALRLAGATVPSNFNDFVIQIKRTYESLLAAGVITRRPEPPAPAVPMDFAWAKSLGLVRKPSAFVSSISDERGEELLYAGVPISRVFQENLGIGGVISLLWFRRRLPDYACKFIEMTLMVTADHGPAVSGAHNTIVTARAGKDMISSLVSGLLTIGPRFGGALDEAAQQFSKAFDSGTSPADFVKQMRQANKLIMGIGHKVKSLSNPDKRVTIMRDFALESFPQSDLIKYALEVEKITTQKKENLILNVDGLIAVAFVDLIRGCGAFTREEADETLASGFLNGLFVVARSIGFIGHFLDQNRLKQDLYRHPTDDITYFENLAG